MPESLPFDEHDIEQLLTASIDQILEHQDPERFLAWARQSFPKALRLDLGDVLPEDQSRVVQVFATTIWNATPLPANGFRPLPLPKPERNAPCPCGSGRKYKLCCAELPPLPSFSADDLWAALCERLSDPQLEQAIASRAVPAAQLAEVGQRWLNEDRPRRVLDLLEPLFSSHPEQLDARFGLALDVLLDAYDGLGFSRKKEELLERIIQEGSRPLRATAWQRRCTMSMDERDFTAAQAAFTEAMRHAPDDVETALLELLLLGTQQKEDAIPERARFWQHKFVRLGYEPDEPVMEILNQAIRDPQGALITSLSGSDDHVLLRLRDWVNGLAAREIPTLALRPVPRRARRSKRGKVNTQSPVQLDPFGAQSPPEAPTLPAAVAGLPAKLEVGDELGRLQTQWHEVFPLAKPFSVQLFPFGGEDPWEDDEWVELLLAQPQSADSLDILDDVAMALAMHHRTGLPWLESSLVYPLLERARRILDALVPADAPQVLPWDIPENRPGLRLLVRLYLYHDAREEPLAAMSVMERLLALDPEDNHGVRPDLMNLYIECHENRKALDLAERYTDDRLFPELGYGRALVLYRLGERVPAADALAQARRQLPEVPRYLIPKRVKKPKLSSLDILPDGEDRAWHYREAMREVWAAEPGALDWLKTLTA